MSINKRVRTLDIIDNERINKKTCTSSELPFNLLKLPCETLEKILLEAAYNIEYDDPSYADDCAALAGISERFSDIIHTKHFMERVLKRNPCKRYTIRPTSVRLSGYVPKSDVREMTVLNDQIYIIYCVFSFDQLRWRQRSNIEVYKTSVLQRINTVDQQVTLHFDAPRSFNVNGLQIPCEIKASKPDRSLFILQAQICRDMYNVFNDSDEVMISPRVFHVNEAGVVLSQWPVDPTAKILELEYNGTGVLLTNYKSLTQLRAYNIWQYDRSGKLIAEHTSTYQTPVFPFGSEVRRLVRTSHASWLFADASGVIIACSKDGHVLQRPSPQSAQDPLSPAQHLASGGKAPLSRYFAWPASNGTNYVCQYDEDRGLMLKWSPFVGLEVVRIISPQVATLGL